MLLTWSHTCLNESWVLWWERRGGQGFQTESLDWLKWKTLLITEITSEYVSLHSGTVEIWIHVDCFHLLVLGFCFLFYYTGQLGRNYWVQDMKQIKFDPASSGEDYNVSTAFMWQSVLIQARSTTHPSSSLLYSWTTGLTLKGWTDRDLISEWTLLWVLGKYLMRLVQ